MDNKEKNENEFFNEDSLLEEGEARKMRRSNKINSFLNSNFQFVSLFLILLVFFFSFSYILIPKYNKIVEDSSKILKENKDIFIKEYKALADNKEDIKVFSQVDQEDLDKVAKIVPEEYSRDYLFTWFTYFLMKHNYNVRSVKIVDVKEINQAVTSNRGQEVEGEEITLSYAPNHFNSLPYDVSSKLGAWVIKAEISGVTYFDLKYLVDTIERNLKITDVTFLSFNPGSRVVEIEALSYYKK